MSNLQFIIQQLSKPMTSPRPLTCYIIGEGTLPVQCATIWQQHGHTIAGIISSDPDVTHWADAHQISYINSGKDLLPFLRQREFDYLFSIVNPLLLPEEALQLPRRMAINYHDAPLPRYAGVHATSWALLHQETEHGITWHQMVAAVDAGAILRQVPVPITPTDTALTLNAKCYDAAIAAFAELVDDLQNGRLHPRPQNLDHRSYFPLCQRPSQSGIISWQNDAVSITALVRALTFGPYPNRLGLPKLWLGRELLLVSAAELLAAPSTQAPGVILAASDDSLHVATRSQPIALRHLTTLTGQPVSPPDLLRRNGLRIGSHLPELDRETAVALTATDADLCVHEPFWRARLAAGQPAGLPFLRYKPTAAPPSRYASRASFLPTDDPALLLAALVVYLFRLGTRDAFDLGFYTPPPLPDVSDLWAQYVPLRLALQADYTLSQVVTAVQTELDRLQRRRTYSRDIVLRYPDLRGLTWLRAAQPFPVAVAIVAQLEAYRPQGVDCVLVIAPGQGARWQYHPEALDDDSMRRLDAQVRALLANMQTNPSQTVAHWSLLPDVERRQVLETWQGTAVAYPSTPLPHELFAAHAAAQPDAPAIVTYAGTGVARQWHYAEVNRRANQLAHRLQAVGVGPDTPVGVLLPRSAELVVAQLAVLKAGGTYLPIDPAYPRARIHFMISDGLDAQRPVVIATPALAARLALDGVITIPLEMLSPAGAAVPDSDPAHNATPDSLAYVIYTSGTTGQPKGVQISQRGLRNLLAWHEHAFAIRPSDRLSQIFAPAFDGSVCDIWPALAAGASIHIPDEETRLTPWLLRDWLVTAGITIAFLPTPLGERVLPLEWPRHTALRLLRVGGDRLHEYPPPDLPFRVSNEYGPTENSVVSTQTFLPAQSPTTGAPGDAPPPIGRPIANTYAYVLDRCRQPTPSGIPGELHVGGDGLSPGYLHQPELTGLRFTIDDLRLPTTNRQPFDKLRTSSSIVNRRLYRTGDLVAWLPDGQLHFLGRLDYQVKIRGFRVELGEIEAVLAQQPDVETAVVVAYPHPSGEKQLAAYYVPAPNVRLSPADLRARLQERLPAYMIPAVWMRLNHMPLTSHGKVNREALPPPTLEETTPYLPPRTATETAVAQLWEELLDARPIGADHAFFEMGGNSLLATQVVARLRAQFGVTLSLPALFAAPTVAALSARIDLLRQAAQPTPVSAADWEEGEL
ncbi:MAG: amino acid adenylation domain-containing protein [Anaerolinea sp.]|nr:amino acid adenylation domain-containing protein [Anaerolinea sp.]